MRVFRYQLAIEDAVQTVALPYGAQVLSVAFKPCDRTLNLWASVPEDHEALAQVHHRFRVVGTGWPGRLTDADRFVGTVMVDAGALMFHVFEVYG
jgi:hypothetical protein